MYNTRFCLSLVLVLFLLVSIVSSFAQDNSPFQNPDIFPLQDYVIFARLGKSIDDLRIVREFGVFRNLDSVDLQFIEEIPREEFWPGSLAPTRYLSLQYILSAGKYNGFWLRLRQKGDESWFNWESFRDSILVLRLGMGESCTSRFKLEIKYYDSKFKTVRTAYTYVVIDDTGLEEIRNQGFTDVDIPLSKIIGTNELASMREMVIVLEGNEVDALEGELKLYNIRFAQETSNESDIVPLLEDLNRRAFSWFVNNRHPVTGLIRDRSENYVGFTFSNDISSIASIGFYLSALPYAIESGYIDGVIAKQDVINTLLFLRDRVEHHYGIYPHFLFLSSGKCAWQSEFSLLDSALLFNGIMVASVYFGQDVTNLADEILNRVDWTKYLLDVNGRTLLSMGWNAEQKKILGPMDVRSSEFSMPIFLAIGSGQVDKEIWYNTEIRRESIEGYDVLNPTHGLFTSYYSLCWWDLENKQDQEGVDLFQNARNVALANRTLTRKNPAETYSVQHGGFWGTSAGDYGLNYIAPSILDIDSVRTVWPITSLAEIVFLPDIIEADLVEWQSSDIWPYINGPYGLAPFSIDKNYVAPDLIGIDIGSYSLNYINYKNKGVWKWFNQHRIAIKAKEELYSGDVSKWGIHQ